MKKKNNLKLGMLALATAVFILTGCNDSDDNGNGGSTGGNGSNGGNGTGELAEARDLIAITADKVPEVFEAFASSIQKLDENVWYLFDLAGDANSNLDLDVLSGAGTSGQEGCDTSGSYQYSYIGDDSEPPYYTSSNRNNEGEVSYTFSSCQLDGFFIDDDTLNGNLNYKLEESDNYVESLEFNDLSAERSDGTYTFNGGMVKEHVGFANKKLTTSGLELIKGENEFLRVYDLEWTKRRGSSGVDGFLSAQVDYYGLSEGSFKVSTEAAMDADANWPAGASHSDGEVLIAGSGGFKIEVYMPNKWVVLLDEDDNEICSAAYSDADDWWNAANCNN